MAGSKDESESADRDFHDDRLFEYGIYPLPEIDKPGEPYQTKLIQKSDSEGENSSEGDDFNVSHHGILPSPEIYKPFEPYQIKLIQKSYSDSDKPSGSYRTNWGRYPYSESEDSSEDSFEGSFEDEGFNVNYHRNLLAPEIDKPSQPYQANLMQNRYSESEDSFEGESFNVNYQGNLPSPETDKPREPYQTNLVQNSFSESEESFGDEGFNVNYEDLPSPEIDSQAAAVIEREGENSVFSLWSVIHSDDNCSNMTVDEQNCSGLMHSESLYETEMQNQHYENGGMDYSEQQFHDKLNLHLNEEESVDFASLLDYDADQNASNYTDQQESARRIAESDESSFSAKLAKLGRIAEVKDAIKAIVDVPLTKSGSTRKKRLFKLSVKERAAKKIEYQQLKHGVRTACTHKACKDAIDTSRRQDINKQFWESVPSERYTFGHGSIERKEVKRRKKERASSRSNTFVYRLKKENGEFAIVCKTFFLTTLGYAKNNDAFIKHLMGKTNYKKPLPRRSKQGKHQKTPKKDRELIYSHIKSFNPVVSHHRRIHAPKRLYLPSEITIQMMYNHFSLKHPDYKCSYELYRNIVSNEMNISFTVLGNEECEDCEEYFNHKKSDPNCDSCTEICEPYKKHKLKYDEARALYDKQRLSNSEHLAAYSLDLQKVIMLPRLEMFKVAIFCPRAIFFNESFVPLGGKKKGVCQPVSMLWHEGISGRNAEDFVSAIYKFLLSKRDHDEVILWLDNCSAQNKNWKLYSFLPFIINSNEIATNKIILNYFEPGHSFMSADSFHHQVEMAMARKKKVYDFNDLKECVLNANSGDVTLHEMRLSDFFEWTDCSSKTKLQKASPRPYMKDMVQVTATRGSYDLTYKTSFSGEDIPLDFLLQTCKNRGIPKPEVKQNYRGISEDRKMGIIKKMRKIMIPNRLEFWKNIPVTNQQGPIYGSDEEWASDNDESDNGENNNFDVSSGSDRSFEGDDIK